MSLDFALILSTIPPLTLDIDVERVSEMLAKVDLDAMTLKDVEDLRQAVLTLTSYKNRCENFRASLQSNDPVICKEMTLREAVVV